MAARFCVFCACSELNGHIGDTSGERQPKCEGQLSHCSNREGTCVFSTNRIAKKEDIDIL
jgi:hypothetical protein